MSRLAVVGCEASGKTVFMAALADYFRLRADRPERPCLVPENAEANRFAAFLNRQMRVLRQWPPATPPERTVRMDWTLRRDGATLADVGMIEFGGETFRAAFREDIPAEKREAAVAELVQFLSGADYVILLVSLREVFRDPGTVSAEEFERETEAQWVTRGLIAFVREKLPRARLVIGLTQADVYRDQLAAGGGGAAAFAAYWPSVRAVSGDIPIFEVASVSRVDGEGLPAENYDTEGVAPIMEDFLQRAGRDAKATPVKVAKKSGNARKILLAAALLVVAGAAAWWQFGGAKPATAPVAVAKSIAKVKQDRPLTNNVVKAKSTEANPGRAGAPCTPDSSTRSARRADPTEVPAGRAVSTKPSLAPTNQVATVETKPLTNAVVKVKEDKPLTNNVTKTKPIEMDSGRAGAPRTPDSPTRFARRADPAEVSSGRAVSTKSPPAPTNLVAKVETKKVEKTATNQMARVKTEVKAVASQVSEVKNEAKKPPFADLEKALAEERVDEAAKLIAGISKMKSTSIERVRLERAKKYHACIAAALDGDVAAQNRLAGFYYSGTKLIPRNFEKAFLWYRLSAEAGDADAQMCLAVMYEEGKGVAADSALANDWYRRAAEGGAPDAMYRMGVIVFGRKTPESRAEAYEWFKKAKTAGTTIENIDQWIKSTAPEPRKTDEVKPDVDVQRKQKDRLPVTSTENGDSKVVTTSEVLDHKTEAKVEALAHEVDAKAGVLDKQSDGETEVGESRAKDSSAGLDQLISPSVLQEEAK